MTQLYVGNLSEHGDEKNIRLVFGKYGSVREVLMKNGYAFVEMETALQAEHVMRELNGELTRQSCILCVLLRDKNPLSVCMHTQPNAVHVVAPHAYKVFRVHLT